MIRELGLGDAIYSLSPEAQWTIEDEDLSRLNWVSKEIERPSDEEIIAELDRIREAQLVAVEEAEIARSNALAKLAALGLTELELKNLIGL